MKLDAPGLETGLVRLEPFEARHRAGLLASGAQEDLWHLMPTIPAGNTLPAYFDHTTRLASLGAGQGYAVLCQDTGAFIGFAAFVTPNRLHRRIRVGYTWLEKARRGGPSALHVQYLLIRRATEWRARRVEWMMSVRSERGAAMLDRLGIAREGILRQYSRMADGSWEDVIVFSLVGDELRAMLAGLETELGETLHAASGP